MKIVTYFLLASIGAAFPAQRLFSRSGIVSTLSGGRLGDNLVAVAHAAWLSHKYGYQLAYMPFEYSDKLVLAYKAPRWSHEWAALFTHHVRYPLHQGMEQSVRTNADGTCIIIPYFSEFLSEYGVCADFKHLTTYPFAVNWRDAAFKELLRNLFTPVEKVARIPLPADRISVALHMRRGGGFDPAPSDGTLHHGASLDKGFPLKCPPVRFYIDQLISLYENLGKKPLYVFLFTDDAAPEVLIREIQRWVGDRDILFDWRKSGNSHDSNVLEDFVNMQRFNCMIRPQSNLSYMAARLGSLLIEIEPYAARWDGPWLVVTHARIVFSNFQERIVACDAERYRSETYTT